MTDLVELEARIVALEQEVAELAHKLRVLANATLDSFGIGEHMDAKHEFWGPGEEG